MVNVTAAGWVGAGDSAGVDICLDAGAIVCDDNEDGGVVIPALHALQLLIRCGVAQPPAHEATQIHSSP